jgi:hypothetical protein
MAAEPEGYARRRPDDPDRMCSGRVPRPIARGTSADARLDPAFGGARARDASGSDPTGRSSLCRLDNKHGILLSNHYGVLADIRALPMRGIPVLDVLFLASGLAFFGLSLGYAALCDRL